MYRDWKQCPYKITQISAAIDFRLLFWYLNKNLDYVVLYSTSFVSLEQ